MSFILKDKKRSIGFSYAWNGIVQAFRRERNFRIHTIVAGLVILSGFFFSLTKMEWVSILFATGFVMTMEILNSAIETIIDYMRPEIHPQAKVIKDLAAGAVLVAAFVAALIGSLIFIPKLFHL